MSNTLMIEATLRAMIAAVTAADVVRGNAPLLVGRAGQSRSAPRCPVTQMLDLHRVAHGVDVRHGGLHPVIDHDAALACPVVSPASLASSMSGVTPMARTTMSACRAAASPFSSTSTPPSVCLKARPRNGPAASLTPCLPHLGVDE